LRRASCCPVLSCAQVKAQAEVVARAARDKLHSLPSGDYEETDEELERFAADFEQVGSVARQISGDCATAHCMVMSFTNALCISLAYYAS